MLTSNLRTAGSRLGNNRSVALGRLSHQPRLEKPRRLQNDTAQEIKRSRLSRHLVLMVKAPVLGRVKTRLARGIGPARATSFYRSVTNSVLSRVANSKRWHTYLAVSPNPAIENRAWPFQAGGGDVDRFAQGRGDLGQRMQRVMDGMPAGPVVIIGSDIPSISSNHISSAFRALGQADVVFGTSPDGGYWLVGMSRIPRVHQAFDQVRWSSRLTLSDTQRNCNGCTIAHVAELSDIDDVDDLTRAGAAATRRILPK